MVLSCMGDLVTDSVICKVVRYRTQHLVCNTGIL